MTTGALFRIAAIVMILPHASVAVMAYIALLQAGIKIKGIANWDAFIYLAVAGYGAIGATRRRMACRLMSSYNSVNTLADALNFSHSLMLSNSRSYSAVYSKLKCLSGIGERIG